MNEGFKNRREGDNEGKMDREPRYSIHVIKVVIKRDDEEMKKTWLLGGLAGFFEY